MDECFTPKKNIFSWRIKYPKIEKKFNEQSFFDCFLNAKEDKERKELSKLINTFLVYSCLFCILFYVFIFYAFLIWSLTIPLWECYKLSPKCWVIFTGGSKKE